MDIATSGPSRLVRLALYGVMTAFAGILLSVVFGFTAGAAHAQEDDGNSLLGAVTGLVDDTTSAVTQTVTSVSTTATETVAEVVAVLPAPVQQPVQEVVQSTGTVVHEVVQPVADLASSGVVGGVTQPVVDVVTAVPIVGDVVTAIGADTAIEDVVGSVDATLGGVTQAVAGTGSALTPVVPSVPGVDVIPGTDATGIPALLPSSATVDAADVATIARVTTGKPAFQATPAAPATTIVAQSAGAPLAFPTGDPCPSDALSLGSGGAGPGAWALGALLPFAAHRAWVRRAGPEDDSAPPAPVASTDVSPD